MFCFKALLNSFEQSTSLKVNYHKSSLYPINLSHENAELFAGLLGCSIGAMPFTYLGLPMGTTRAKIVDFAAMVDRVERRWTASSHFFKTRWKAHFDQLCFIFNSNLLHVLLAITCFCSQSY